MMVSLKGQVHPVQRPPESTSPTVAIGHQSVKRGGKGGNAGSLIWYPSSKEAWGRKEGTSEPSLIGSSQKG